MLKLTPYNPCDILETQEDIAWYLTESLNDDNPMVFVMALGHVVKHRGVAKVAKAAGLNRESLYKIINQKSAPQWETVSPFY
jgi:probable addiction module antidote protein